MSGDNSKNEVRVCIDGKVTVLRTPVRISLNSEGEVQVQYPMTISEATMKALETGKRMYRRSFPSIFIQPTDTPDFCVISNMFGHELPRWAPQADDLIARDWMLED